MDPWNLKCGTLSTGRPSMKSCVCGSFSLFLKSIFSSRQWLVIHSLISSSLLTRELAFARKKLGTGGLRGAALSLACSLACLPHFRLLTQRHLRLLLVRLPVSRRLHILLLSVSKHPILWIISIGKMKTPWACFLCSSLLYTESQIWYRYRTLFCC